MPHLVPQDVTYETWYGSLDREAKEHPSIVALAAFLKNSDSPNGLSNFWKTVNDRGCSVFFGPLDFTIRAKYLKLIRATLPILGRFGDQKDLQDIDYLVTVMGKWWP